MTATASLDLDPGILDLGGRVVFVPVRHHSPACARLVRRLVVDGERVEGPVAPIATPGAVVRVEAVIEG